MTDLAPNFNSTEENIPCFIRKTYKILEDGQYSNIICWNDEGNAIIIKNPAEFAQSVLPIYFKHNNLNSFIRQLNMYDFHKKKTPDGEHVYYHELFQRDKKYLLKNIKRKNTESSVINNEKSRLGMEINRTKQDIAAIINENTLLKKINREHLTTITSLEAKINDLTFQNQTLLSQIVKLTEKEEMMRVFIPNVKRETPTYPLSAIDINIPTVSQPNKLGQTTTRIPQFSTDIQNQRNWNILGENFPDLSIPNYYNQNATEAKLLNSEDLRKLAPRPELSAKGYQDSSLAAELSQQIVRNLEEELQYLKKLTASNSRANTGLNSLASPDPLMGKRRIETDPGQIMNPYETLNKLYKPEPLPNFGLMPNLFKPEGEDLMNYQEL